MQLQFILVTNDKYYRKSLWIDSIAFEHKAYMYSFLEMLVLFHPPFSSVKSDHPTLFLFLSLTDLHNFNMAEYSQPRNIFFFPYNYTHHANCQYVMKDNFCYYKKLKR